MGKIRDHICCNVVNETVRMMVEQFCRKYYPKYNWGIVLGDNDNWLNDCVNIGEEWSFDISEVYQALWYDVKKRDLNAWWDYCMDFYDRDEHPDMNFHTFLLNRGYKDLPNEDFKYGEAF